MAHTHPLVEKTRTARAPIAELIGFEAEEIGGGRAVATLPQWAWHS